jgi:hypothetical protein
MVAPTYPDWRWGMKLTPARLAARQPNRVVKATLEGVTSSTTYQDDNELLFPVVANAHYFVMVLFNVNGATGGDIKTRYSVPAGATGFKWCMGPQVGSADRENTNMVSAVHNPGTDRPYGTVAASTAAIAVREYLRVQTAGASGNVVLQWAQNASSGTTTSVDVFSSLMWWRVG